MKTTKLFLLGVFALFMLNSCSNDDDLPEDLGSQADYTNGTLVLNEGGTGSVTWISDDLTQVEQEIYAAENAGDDLGQYTQSMFFNEQHAYIISNGSNLITVVDRTTFELVGKVESGLEVPMYGVIRNGKAYVTNIGSFDDTTDDYVAVINLETLEVEETIKVNDRAEYITEENGLLYIQNASFGFGNKVTVVDPSTNNIQSVLEVTEGLNSIEVEGNTLYALSSGKLEVIDLSTDQLIYEIVFESTGAQNLELEGESLYYTIGSSVYTVDVGATEPAQSPLIEYSSESDYGVMYGFEVEEGRIYIGDAGDFASNSFIEIYTTAGDLLERITVGIAPNNFYVN